MSARRGGPDLTGGVDPCTIGGMDTTCTCTEDTERRDFARHGFPCPHFTNPYTTNQPFALDFIDRKLINAAARTASCTNDIINALNRRADGMAPRVAQDALSTCCTVQERYTEDYTERQRRAYALAAAAFDLNGVMDLSYAEQAATYAFLRLDLPGGRA